MSLWAWYGIQQMTHTATMAPAEQSGRGREQHILSDAACGDEDAKVTTAFPWNVFPEFKGWRKALKLIHPYLDLSPDLV